MKVLELSRCQGLETETWLWDHSALACTDMDNECSPEGILKVLIFELEMKVLDFSRQELESETWAMGPVCISMHGHG